MMRRTLINGALVLSLSLCASTVVLAKGKKTRPSPEHVAAIKKCKEDYAAAVKSAKGLKDRERRDAVAKAKVDEKQCIASAPK